MKIKVIKHISDYIYLIPTIVVYNDIYEAYIRFDFLKLRFGICVIKNHSK